MVIEFLDADDKIVTKVDCKNPTAEFEHLQKMLPNVVKWKEHVEVETLEQGKARHIKAAGSEFAKRRDAIRWVDNYGYDCAAEDITNFMAAYTPLLVAKSGSTHYKVWFTDTTKGVVERNYEQMLAVYNTVRESQLEAYAWYEAIKANLQAAESIEELEQIYPLGGE